MADLSIEIRGPPGLLSVTLQLPYAANPGTLTEWLLRDTVREPGAGAVLIYARLSPLDADNLFDRS
jgi:hypothetical protein